MKNRTLVLGLLAAGSLMLSPLVVSAQPDGPGKGKNHEKMMAELKLTAEQNEQLKGLHQQHRQDMKPFQEKMKGIRDKVKAELLKPAPSKPALDGYAAELGDLHKQMALKRNEHLLQMKAILTAEQFAKLVNKDWMGGERMKGRSPRHGKGKDGCKQKKGSGPDEQ
jgi:Spy/CpxP family protein refolding chaperone